MFGETISDPALAEARVKNPKASDPLPRFDAFDALAAVSAAIKPEITHEVRRLLIEVADEKREGRLELQGALDSLAQRDEIVSQLEQHPCFHDIELGKHRRRRATQDRINYQIEADGAVRGRRPGRDARRPSPRRRRPSDEPATRTPAQRLGGAQRPREAPGRHARRVVAAVFVLGFPLFWTAHQNAEIDEENDAAALRARR